MGSELLLIIAGIILRHNADWFGGAHLVGTICLVVGLVIAAIEVVLFLATVVFGVSTLRGTRRH